MEVAKDTVVTIEYQVRLKNGEFVKGSPSQPASMNFVVGYDQVLPALEHRLLGLKENETVEFTIPYQEAFGPYRKDLVKRKTFEEFPEGENLETGKWVIAKNPQTKSQYSYKVLEKTDKEVLLDFNHPLAGQDLYYKVKIVKVRKATEEELRFLRPCEFKPPDQEE